MNTLKGSVCMNFEEKFETYFNEKPSREYFSPGRINLIGEHIDYSGGSVLPCAITMGTTAYVSERKDRKICFISFNMEDLGIIEVDLDNLEKRDEDAWTNYPKGIFKLLMDRKIEFNHGLNIAYYGNIPYASGLSSSASILMATAVIVDDVYDLQMERLDLVKLTKEVENDYIGVSTGIMDQFAIGFGKENYCMLLNTNTLDYKYIPLDLKDNAIVIMNTNVKRGLADSAYNERRAECDQAFAILSKEYDIEYLCDLSLEQLEAKKDLLPEGNLYKRAYHAVSENERTIKATEVLSNGDLETFGELMKQSHISLRDHYEVTGLELDTLFDAAKDFTGTVGVRVTGAGFGGCAIAIVQNDAVDSFIETVKAKYKEVVGHDADFYVGLSGNGTRRVK